MSYSVDLRSRAVDYARQGHTQEETSAVFQIGVTTLKRWLKQQTETGSLEKAKLNRSARIFKSQELNDYVEINPDALIKDVAQYFGGSMSGAFYALEREKITFKKKRFTIKKEMR